MTPHEEKRSECCMEAWLSIMHGHLSCSWGKVGQSHQGVPEPTLTLREILSFRDVSVLMSLPRSVPGWVMASHKLCWEFQCSAARALVGYIPYTGHSVKCILMVTQKRRAGSSRQWVPRYAGYTPVQRDWTPGRVAASSCIHQGQVPQAMFPVGGEEACPPPPGMPPTRCRRTSMLIETWTSRLSAEIRSHLRSVAIQPGLLQAHSSLRHSNQHCVC